MKSISITTIICGTALILAPIVQNILTLRLIADLISKVQSRVDLTGPLEASYSSWGMFIGLCTIISELIVGVRSGGSAENRVAARADLQPSAIQE